MGLHGSISAALVWLAVGAAIPAGAGVPRHAESPEELEAKIQRERDPIKRAKLQIKLFRFDLQQAVAAYDAQQLDQGAQLLSKYLDEVKRCWKTLQSSGKVAAKHSAGFKDFDIALRENIRQLNDLEQRLLYANGGPVRTAMRQAQEIRNENLLALFPGLKMKQAAKSASREPHGQPPPHPLSP